MACTLSILFVVVVGGGGGGVVAAQCYVFGGVVEGAGGVVVGVEGGGVVSVSELAVFDFEACDLGSGVSVLGVGGWGVCGGCGLFLFWPPGGVWLLSCCGLIWRVWHVFLFEGCGLF